MLSSRESLSEKFVNKGFWLYAFIVILGPLGYMIRVLITRDLSVEEVGMFYGVLSFVLLLSTYSDFGCTDSLNYFLPRHIVKNEYGKAKYLIFIVLFFQLCTSISIYVILFFLAPWLSEYFFKADVTYILRIAGLYFIGNNLLHLANTFFVSAQDTKLQKGMEFVRLISTAIGTSILFFTDFGDLERYLYVWLIALIIGILFGTFYVLKKYYIPYFLRVKMVQDGSLRSEFFRYSLATLLTANIGMVLSQVDMQLIIYFLGSKEVGYYSTYLSLINIPFMILTPIIGFLYPVISELSGRGEQEKIQEVIGRFWKYFGILGIWTGFFLFELSGPLSILFFGEKFRESGEILAFSGPFIIFNFLFQICFQVLAGTGQVRKRAKILGITLVINIILNLVLIPYMGTKGSALAVSLSWIPLYYMSVRATGLVLPLFGDRDWYINILTGSIAALATYGIKEVLGMTHSFLIILLAILVYMIIFILTNIKMLKDMVHTIKQVRNDAKKPPVSDTPLPL